MIDEERLVAWLCGEVHGSEADAVAAAVAADPALSARAAAHRAAEARLRAAFDPILAEPLPQALRDAVAGAAVAPIDLAAVRAARQAGQAAAAAPAARRGLPVPYWAALAATLVIGVAIGNVVRPVAGEPPAAAIVASADGGLQAHGMLARALDTQLASAAQPGPVRVVLSFRDHADRLCRTWTIAAQSGVGQASAGQAGIACKTGEAWQIAASVASPGQPAGAYRMAAGSSPQLAAAVETMIAGDPLDAAAERRALAAGWR